jgi:hypothetical protein
MARRVGELITAKADSKYQMALIRRPNAATARHRWGV